MYNDNGQLSLFEQNKPVDSIENEAYAVLLHGASDAFTPAFVNISFPNERWTSYIQSIDLLALHPNVISTDILRAEPIEVEEPVITYSHIHISPEEKIQEPQQPRIRPLRKRSGEEL